MVTRYSREELPGHLSTILSTVVTVDLHFTLTSGLGGSENYEKSGQLFCG